jgi:hypothetical protein
VNLAAVTQPPSLSTAFELQVERISVAHGTKDGSDFGIQSVKSLCLAFKPVFGGGHSGTHMYVIFVHAGFTTGTAKPSAISLASSIA